MKNVYKTLPSVFLKFIRFVAIGRELRPGDKYVVLTSSFF